MIMSSDKRDPNSHTDRPKRHEGVDEENAASKQTTVSRRTILLGSTAIGAAAAVAGSAPAFVPTAAAQGAAPQITSSNAILAKRGFKGVIKLDARDSTPDWTPFTPARAPEGSPNILV